MTPPSGLWKALETPAAAPIIELFRYANKDVFIWEIQYYHHHHDVPAAAKSNVERF
jgi:hypothetical protein